MDTAGAMAILSRSPQGDPPLRLFPTAPVARVCSAFALTMDATIRVFSPFSQKGSHSAARALSTTK